MGDDAPDWGREIDALRRSILRDLTGDMEPGVCADLGCGTGLFAIDMADAGWTVHALDARARDWPDHPRVTFTVQDVRDVALAKMKPDLVLCLGLFYHLELADQLALLKKCKGVPLILDTHVSAANGVTERGFEGHCYGEPPGILSSFGNDTSFWPTLDSLRKMLKAAGYKSVTPLEPWYHGDRTFFTCQP